MCPKQQDDMRSLQVTRRKTDAEFDLKKQISLRFKPVSKHVLTTLEIDCDKRGVKCGLSKVQLPQTTSLLYSWSVELVQGVDNLRDMLFSGHILVVCGLHCCQTPNLALNTGPNNWGKAVSETYSTYPISQSMFTARDKSTGAVRDPRILYPATKSRIPDQILFPTVSGLKRRKCRFRYPC